MPWKDLLAFNMSQLMVRDQCAAFLELRKASSLWKCQTFESVERLETPNLSNGYYPLDSIHSIAWKCRASEISKSSQDKRLQIENVRVVSPRGCSKANDQVRKLMTRFDRERKRVRLRFPTRLNFQVERRLTLWYWTIREPNETTWSKLVLSRPCSEDYTLCLHTKYISIQMGSFRKATCGYFSLLLGH